MDHVLAASNLLNHDIDGIAVLHIELLIQRVGLVRLLYYAIARKMVHTSFGVLRRERLKM